MKTSLDRGQRQLEVAYFLITFNTQLKSALSRKTKWKIGRNAIITCLGGFSHCCWILKQLVVKAFKHSFTTITEILHRETTKKGKRWRRVTNKRYIKTRLTHKQYDRYTNSPSLILVQNNRNFELEPGYELSFPPQSQSVAWRKCEHFYFPWNSIECY